MVNLPVDAKNQSLTQSTGNLIKINIRKSGAYVLMGKQVTEEQISDWMKTEVEKKPDIKVLIRSDQDAKHLYPNVFRDLVVLAFFVVTGLKGKHGGPCGHLQTFSNYQGGHDRLFGN